MRLTTMTRYGVTAMLDLAIHHDKGPVALAEMAERQRVSLSYLEQLFARLRKQGLVQGIRGPGGGYRLARTTREITVADIVSAIDETVMRPASSLARDETGLTPSKLWQELARRIYDFLGTITLASLIEEHALAQLNRGNDQASAGIGTPETQKQNWKLG